MNKSESIAELSKALSKAQGEIGHAKKDADNPFFKSKYATLAGVIDTAKAALAANGLAVAQTTLIVDGAIVLETTLLHSSGEWISGQYPVDPVKKDPQGYGSALTYSRRYALSALIGIASDDDDGNEATKPSDKNFKPSAYPTAVSRKKACDPIVMAYNKIMDPESGLTPDKEFIRIFDKAKPILDGLLASGNEDDKQMWEAISDAASMAEDRMKLQNV